MSALDVVFDGPPGPVSGRFIECENEHGTSVSAGTWIDRGDGTWALRIDVTDTLAEVLEAQRALQIDAFDNDPAEPESQDARVEFMTWNVLALLDEVHEALNEIGWKPWASSRHVNADLVLNELIDALHFWMNLVWSAVGTSTLGDAHVLAQVIRDRYHAKHEINAARQRDGYDGVSSKCPSCHRELSEVGTEETRIGRTPTGGLRCGGCKERLS